MLKRIVCCAFALLVFSRISTIAFAASPNGAEATASITGYGLLVPRTSPGGGESGSSGGGSSVRDSEPLAALETIPDAEIPLAAAPTQNSRLPNTGAAANLDFLWMLLLLALIVILLSWSQKRNPDPYESGR